MSQLRFFPSTPSTFFPLAAAQTRPQRQEKGMRIVDIRYHRTLKSHARRADLRCLEHVPTHVHAYLLCSTRRSHAFPGRRSAVGSWVVEGSFEYRPRRKISKIHAKAPIKVPKYPSKYQSTHPSNPASCNCPVSHQCQPVRPTGAIAENDGF
ncbi:hypothetical protein BZA05DRAFT_406657 [Tricharina praecox]|uniref:uncharacterized protein n=1 Tax=Tricharina praecox TaxID=43433 RepID=UPI0022200CF8|nr:uncharacterized protein BZA05DRAFT_406657 [Tricharina praecox]KAI5846802.1 hypothetical protein BZA05DRAFT_406657 [Tricharina praecox]